jgi:hypothetical protein
MLLELKLEKDLLYFACRQHILELVLVAVFAESMVLTPSDLDVAIFKRFQQSWKNIE